MTFAPGDSVLLATRNLPIKLPGSRKLKPLWVGPYPVVRRVGENAYELKLPDALASLHPVFNVSVLKGYAGSVIPPPDPVELDTGPEFEVDAILRHRRVGRRRSRLEYLVSFLGYDSSHNEWLPAVNLANASRLLNAYNRTHGLA